MKISSKQLIEDLIQRTHSVLNHAETYLQLSEDKLNWKSDPSRWSILECIEHLNRYGDFYLPEINDRIRNTKTDKAKDIFKSGILGNYFAEMMLPKEKLNKMNTFKNMNPAGSKLDKTVIKKFINHQKQLLDLLDKARKVDLSKVKTSISISKWIKLRLGDTFRVVIYHNQRHIKQADKVLELVSQENKTGQQT